MELQNTILKDNLYKTDLTRDDIKYLMLLKEPVERKQLFNRAYQIKEELIGKKVYYRGLIEFSNICGKDCYYCGIRRDNKNNELYELTDDEVFDAVNYAMDARFGSIVIQAGERNGKKYSQHITSLIRKIKEISNGKIGITLSLGEQDEETYRQWFEAGAHRYLLRIEVSTPALYAKLHPNNKKHNFQQRLKCLQMIKDIGYQVGTGVMIGLPFQTIDDLVDDLMFMKNFDVDMVGMGPYIEHPDTPLYQYRNTLIPRKERFNLTLNMIATLRILMRDINIASTTALQAIDPLGREKGLKAGANIIMPNITPCRYRKDYKLYEDKPCIDENPDDCKDCLEKRIGFAGDTVAQDEWGDSLHFKNRMKVGING